jgi:translation initiation factor 2 subunit 2
MQVRLIGSKRTGWGNFAETCQTLGRKPGHLMNYVLVELGTIGSIDGSHNLIIKGRFQQKQIEYLPLSLDSFNIP